MSEIVITSDNFQEEVINSQIPVLVDFWAEWCGPCKMLSPIIDEIAKDYEGKLKVGKVNVDEQQELAAKFSIMSIPTLKVFKDGKEVNTSVGYMPKEALLSMLKL